MSGVVTSLDAVDKTYDIPGGFIHLESSSEYPAVLSCHSMNDDPTDFDETKLPSIGDELNTVVFNFVDGKLYLTAQPRELTESRIEQWRRYWGQQLFRATSRDRDATVSLSPRYAEYMNRAQDGTL